MMLNMKNFAKPGIKRHNMLPNIYYPGGTSKVGVSPNAKCQTCFRAVGFRGKHSVEFQVAFPAMGILYI